MDPIWIELLKLGVAGAIGALSAVLSQGAAAHFAMKRHRIEVEEKRRDSWLALLQPIGERRISALESMHDIVQDVIETGKLDMAAYRDLRRASIYLPDHDRKILLESLVAVIQTSGASPAPEVLSQLKACQGNFRSHLGLPSVNSELSRALTLRREEIIDYD